MPQTLVLEDVVASGMDAVVQNIWTAMPGRVESYDAAHQHVNVRVTVKSHSVGEDGDIDAEVVAVLNAVPVVHIGGSGFRSYFPPARGDTCLVIFCSRSIDRWLATGGVAVDPFFQHKHDLSDGVAIVGLRDFAHPLTNAPSDRASIGHDSGATIEFRPGEIRAGGDSGTQQTFMADSFMSAIDTMWVAIASAFTGLPAGAGVAAGTAVTTAKGNFDAAIALNGKTAILKVK